MCIIYARMLVGEKKQSGDTTICSFILRRTNRKPSQIKMRERRMVKKQLAASSKRADMRWWRSSKGPERNFLSLARDQCRTQLQCIAACIPRKAKKVEETAAFAAAAFLLCVYQHTHTSPLHQRWHHWRCILQSGSYLSRRPPGTPPACSRARPRKTKLLEKRGRRDRGLCVIAPST